jgi:uncharacterized membrane protein
MSHLWFLKPPYTLFDFGLFLIILGIVYTCIGKAYVRFNGWVYRVEEPKRYWSAVSTYYIFGAVMIGLFLYEVGVYAN